jgi:serine/threonine-protein kinase
MGKGDWEKVETIVDEVLELPREDWFEYVEKQCEASQEVKSEVTKLLQSIADSEGWLEDANTYKKNLTDSTFEESAPSSLVGTKVGAYRISEVIARGGMGTVYRGERADGEFEHTVAIKVIRMGMDTPENIRLFNRERNILAGLNHPGIAKLFDGGVIENGIPYLIMEYVDGTPIDQYCNKNDLSITERLELFKAVCRAVQHAHNNLIIHRDLKPDNILITEQEQVKILDFGIAKLLDNEEDSDENITRTQARILTPKYAAPEQFTGQNITLHTDIYALGVLLYKLLTNTHPFDFNNKDITEIEKIIKEKNPLKPSSRKGAGKELQGDLEAIILKAMRKEKSARYNSVAELLEDLQRFEENLPVLAQKESTTYRTRKFLKRNKRPIAAFVIFLLSIVGLTGYYTYQLAQERNQARLEAKKAEEVTDFLIRIFGASDPEEAKGDNIPVQHFLETGVDRIDEMDNQPKVKAALLMTMGQVYDKLGEYEKSKPLHEEAVKISEKVYQEPHPDLVEAYINKGLLEVDLGNFASAESLYKKGIEIMENLGNRPDTLYGNTLSNLALLYEEKGEPKKAVPIHKKAVALDKQLYPEGHRKIAISLNHLALAQQKSGNLQQARINFEETLGILTNQLEEDHPRTITTTHNLALLYRELGMVDRAIPMMEKALAMRKKIYDGEHILIASSLTSMGHLYREKGQLEESISRHKQSLNMVSSLFGESSMYTGFALSGLGRSFMLQGNYEKAEETLRRSADIIEEAAGSESAHTMHAKKFLGDLFLLQGKHTKAQELYEQTEDHLYKVFDRTHPTYAMLLKSFGRLYIARDSLKKAQSYLERSIARFQQKFPDTHWRLAEARLELGRALYLSGDYSTSRELLEENIPYIRNLRGETDPYVVKSREMLDQLSSVSR